jgi:hypothetical protein
VNLLERVRARLDLDALLGHNLEHLLHASRLAEQAALDREVLEDELRACESASAYLCE